MICISQYFFRRSIFILMACGTFILTVLNTKPHRARIVRPLLQILFSIGRSRSLIVWLPEESEKTLSKHRSAHLSVLTHQLQTKPMMLILGGTLFFWPMECLGNLLGNRSFISSRCLSRHFQSSTSKDAIFEGDKYRQWHVTTQYQCYFKGFLSYHNSILPH